ncbi:MAG: HAMP domain-containing protein [Spirulinaceae cyanobacterium SM2_1_0]|nr:HAMP domain-containing protein [Spirulinaceae cyanobacterium SM2_1_0]
MKPVSLRLVLIVPFVLQTAAVVALTGLLSWRNGQAAVNNVAAQLRREVSARVEQELDEHLYLPHRVNQLNAAALSNEQIQITQPESLKRQFLQQLRIFPLLTGNYLATLSGEHFAARRLMNGQLVVAQRSAATGWATERYLTLKPGQRDRLEARFPDFEPRDRPWYRAAIAAGRPAWSPIYLDFSTEELAITAVEPIYDRQGQLSGVLGSDLFFACLNRYLRQIEVGERGVVFVIERNGQLISTSTVDAVTHERSGRVQRRMATASGQPLIRATAQYLRSQFPDLNALQTPQQLDFFTADGEHHFLQVTPFRDDFGLDWLIVVALPEADFMGQITINARQTALLCLGALGLSSVFSVLVARRVSRSLNTLAIASRDLAAASQAEDLPERSPTAVELPGIIELRSLATSFNQMAQHLHQAWCAIARLAMRSRTP